MQRRSRQNTSLRRRAPILAGLKVQTGRARTSERGVALIFALLVMLVLGLLATTVMFTSQGQTWTAVNYRATTQSRYAAEAGIQATMNWLSGSYTAPTSFGSYDMTKNPVQYNGKAVVLSAVSGVSSNYPDSAVVSAYSSAMNKSLTGVSNGSYASYATLLRMNPASGVSWLGSAGGGGVVQTWQVTSVGSVGGLRNATVQVTATYERTSTPLFNYPIEATSNGCQAIYLNGNTVTDSYNSNLGPYSGTNSSKSGGSVATNGNVTLGSGSAVNGTVYVPNTSVGGCPDGITQSGGSYTASSQLSGKLNPPLPWGCTSTPCNPPGTLSTAANEVSTSCTGITGCTKKSTTTLYDGGSLRTANVFSLAPGTYGNLTIDGADVVHVSAGTYNINSINFTADAQFVIDSGPVVFNMAGDCSSGGCPTEGLPSPYSSTEVIYGAGYAGFNGCSGGVTANPNVYGLTTCGPSQAPFSGIPSNLQIVYGGSYTMRLGGMPNAAVIYAPNAGYYTPGAPVGLYGSAVIGNFRDDSQSPFHYDAALQGAATSVGPFRPVGGFSWSKF